jgi:hypothetical protein
MTFYVVFLQYLPKSLILLTYFFKKYQNNPCFKEKYSIYYMYMIKEKLLKMIKEDTKKFLKSKDGKNYVKFLKQQNGIEHLIFQKGVN